MYKPKIKTSYLCSFKIDKSLYKEFRNSDESRTWGYGIYKQWGMDYKNTSLKMKSLCVDAFCECPIEIFCGYGYLKLNEALRAGKNESHYSGLSNVLIRTICSAPTIPENVIVYRLVCDEAIQELTTIRNDNPYTYEERGFMSTSLLKTIVEFKEPYSSHKNLLKIYVNKNTIGAYVSVITSRSEEEILFLPCMTLGLIKKPYKDKCIDKIIYECILLGGNV